MTYTTAGVDVGSGAVKVTIMRTGGADDTVVASVSGKMKLTFR